MELIKIRNKVKKLILKVKNKDNGSENRYYEKARDERSRLHQIQKILSSYKLLAVVGIIFVLASSFFISFLFTFYFNYKFSISQLGFVKVANLSFVDVMLRYKLRFLLLILTLSVVYIPFIYKVRVSYGSLNIGQKGQARWMSRDEIDERFKKIKIDCETPFEGMGGVPVAMTEEHMYIDDTNTNMLCIGTTRSGKDQIIINPLIENLSRAKEQCSIVATDPKGEMASTHIPMLKKRGYECYVLNFIDPVYSSMFNPIKAIMDEYNLVMNEPENIRDFSVAQMLCESVSRLLIPDKEGDNNSFFTNGARDVLSASIYALVEEAYEKDFMTNVLYVKDEENTYEESFHFRDKVNLFSVYNFVVGFGKEGLAKYMEAKGESNFSRLKMATFLGSGNNASADILGSFTEALSFCVSENKARLTNKSSFNILDLGFADKPVAIFICLPDFDRSSDIISSIFIDQVYFILSRMASSVPSGKLNRRIHFILNEFVNLPALPNIGTQLRVGLGRQLIYNLFVQDMISITNKYKEEADSIKSNCGTWIYVKSNDNDTNEEFSKKLGEETYTSVTRTGKFLALRKERTESEEARALLNAKELGELKEGEIVVCADMKRRDLKSNKVRPLPIANLGNNRMQFSYEYQSHVLNFGKALYKSTLLETLTSNYEIEYTDDDFVKEEYIKPLSYIKTKDILFSLKEYKEGGDEMMDILKAFFDTEEPRTIRQNIIKNIIFMRRDMVSFSYKYLKVKSFEEEKIAEVERIIRCIKNYLLYLGALDEKFKQRAFRAQEGDKKAG